MVVLWLTFIKKTTNCPFTKATTSTPRNESSVLETGSHERTKIFNKIICKIGMKLYRLLKIDIDNSMSSIFSYYLSHIFQSESSNNFFPFLVTVTYYFFYSCNTPFIHVASSHSKLSSFSSTRILSHVKTLSLPPLIHFASSIYKRIILYPLIYILQFS